MVLVTSSTTALTSKMLCTRVVQMAGMNLASRSAGFAPGLVCSVGLQVQRGIYFLWLTCIPIAIIWLSAESILVRIVPDPKVARLAGLYLKIVLAGAPGWAAFEGGKRYVQAQGMFNVGLYVLLICAPLNAIMNYLFVWVSRIRTFPCTANIKSAIRLGFHWGSNRSGHHRESAPSMSRSIRVFR